MSHGSVTFQREGDLARVTLSRPELRNAFNDEMLTDLLDIFGEVRGDSTLRAVVLTGAGAAFCAGADLNWMRRVVEYSREESYEDSLRLARMLREIHDCPLPVIGQINGPAIGGGTGLVAVCDIAIASSEAFFAFSETRLGLSPAAISPYLLRKMGEKNLRELFLTGERFSAAAAEQRGLVNAVVSPEDLDAAVATVVEQVCRAGPGALAATKRLLDGIASRDLEEAGPWTAEVITALRLSEEGQEGMRAFLEKRKPRWRKD